jgi:hypothetical protein
MTSQPESVAFLLDEDELGHIVPGWPSRLRLAVCLDPDGGCAMLVHHRDEAGRILDRIAEALQQPVGGFCVVPRHPGCPTRRMLFSEEQRLLALVAESGGLLEMAEDYAINYAFAAEEGLDPEFLTTGALGLGDAGAVMPAAPEPPQAASDRPAPAAPMPSVQHVPQHTGPAGPVVPEPADPAPAAGAAIPPGFRRLSEAERRYGVFVNGLLSLGRSGRVFVSFGDGPAETPAVEIDEVYFRDDLLGLAIPLSCLNGQDSLPQRLAFDPALFPASLIATLEEAAQGVRVTATGPYLYATLSPARVPVLAAAPKPVPPPKPVPASPRPRGMRRALRTGVGGGALALAVLLALRVGFAPVVGSADAQSASNSLRADIFTSPLQKR